MKKTKEKLSKKEVDFLKKVNKALCEADQALRVFTQGSSLLSVIKAINAVDKKLGLI